MQPHPREVAANWIAQARADLESAGYLHEKGRHEAACFSAQQAAEKALKGALYWFAGDRPRTHEISTLIAELVPHLPGIARELHDVPGLDPYYVTTRYPDAIGGGIPANKFFEPEARLAIERARRAVDYVDRALPQVPS